MTNSRWRVTAAPGCTMSESWWRGGTEAGMGSLAVEGTQPQGQAGAAGQAMLQPRATLLGGPALAAGGGASCGIL